MLHAVICLILIEILKDVHNVNKAILLVNAYKFYDQIIITGYFTTAPSERIPNFSTCVDYSTNKQAKYFPQNSE